MLPDIGASEIMVIAIVALIVVGPKDLPVLLRKLGQFMAKLRGMAAEFRASFDEMARQSELDELRKEVEAMRQGQISHFSDIAADANSAVAEIDQHMSDVGVDLQRTATYDYTPPVIEPAPKPKAPRKSAAPKPVATKAAAAPKAKASNARTATVSAPRKPRAKKAAE
jgi:sec-independent protein translocase protein TatB